MVWKIIFGLYAFSLCAFGFESVGKETILPHVSELMLITVSALVFFAYCIFALFYTNAFKLKTCSKNMINISLVATILGNFFVPLWALFASIQGETLYSNVLVSIFMYLFLFVILLVCFIPLYIGFYCYHKSYDQYKNLEKPFITMFAGFSLCSFFLPCLCSYVYQIIVHTYHGALSYNIVSVLCYIYSCACLLGVTLQKRILPKKFWQFSVVPFVLIFEFYPKNWGNYEYFEPFRNQSWLFAFIYIVWIGLFYFMLYRYAFKEEYDNENI